MTVTQHPSPDMLRDMKAHTTLLLPPGNLGQLPQVSGLCPLSAWHTIVCNNKSEIFKAGRVKRRKMWRKEAEGESEEAV